MGKVLEKAINRLWAKPKDYTYNELSSLLLKLGYEEKNKGRSSGSRVAFFNPENKNMIRLHKPHPGNIVKGYIIEQVIESLQNTKEIKKPWKTTLSTKITLGKLRLV